MPPDDAMVAAALGGDREAFAALFERWFDRVHDVARNIVRDPETAAEVAQDTFIVVWERLSQLERPEAFGGWILRIARNRALNRLEREQRSRPHEVDVVTGLHDHGLHDPAGSSRELEPEEISASHDRDGLVQAAAVALGERDSSILDLHLRHGLTPAEIADELGVTANNAHQLLFRMRARLGDAIGAFVLWHRGRPACGGLAAAVAGADAFDSHTLALIERHRRSCDECTDRRAQLVSAEQLFSAAPVVAVAIALRDRVRAGLVDAGVPAGHAGTRGVAETSSVDGTSTPSTDPPTDPSTGSAAPEPGSGVVIGRAPDASSDVGEPTDAVDVDVEVEIEVDVGGDRERHVRRRRTISALVGLAVVLVTVAIGIVIARSGATSDMAGDPATAGATAGPSGDDGPPSSSALLPGSSTGDGELVDDWDGQQRSGSSTPARVASPTLTSESSPDVADADLAVPETTGPPAGGPSPGGATVATVAPASAPGSGPDVAQPAAPAATAPTAPAPPPPAPTTAPATTATPTVAPTPTTSIATTTTTTTTPTTTTTTPTTTTPPAVPKITGFSVVGGPPVLCAVANQSPRTFQWSSVNATSATLVVHGISRNVAANGSIDVCAAGGANADLTVTGPGGADAQIIVVP